MKPAPKDPVANARYRRAILERCQTDEAFREEIWIRCSREFAFFCDVMVFTYDPKTHPKCPNRAFILWPFQEEAAAKILAAIGKHDILIEKSRQMGVTWLIMALMVWMWLFRPGQSFLVGSRKEDLVDKPGDPASLFYKADYIIANLPAWLRPNFERTSRSLQNYDNNSKLNGESTNSNFARGGTFTAIPLDEFPAVDNGYEIQRATRDATNCRLFIGTPAGAAGAYYDQRCKMLLETPDRVLRIHWTLHPEKAAGLYTTDTGEEGGRLLKLDPGYEYPSDYKFILDGKKRSPWYDAQCIRAASPQELAQEVDIDYAASSWQFFDPKLLDQLLRGENRTVRKPLHTGELIFKPDWKAPQWIEQEGARLKLWFHPTTEGKVPEEWNDCVVSCDVSMGTGGEMSSNSVATISRMGEEIGEFVTNQLFPGDFADYSLALCKLFNDALLIWESNGPGKIFSKRIKDSGYRNVYYAQDSETKFVTERTRNPGWTSTKDSKKILLADYRQAIAERTYIPRSEEGVQECGQYIMEPNGTIEHCRALATPDPTATGESHGDRVISKALAVRGMKDIAAKEKPADPEPPINSFGWRQRQRQREQQMAKRQWGNWSRSA